MADRGWTERQIARARENSVAKRRARRRAARQRRDRPAAANPAWWNGEYYSYSVMKIPFVMGNSYHSFCESLQYFSAKGHFPGHFRTRFAAPNCWQPSALAAGPFTGLQGGGVAEALPDGRSRSPGRARKWGTAVSATAWFLRRRRWQACETQLAVLTEGGRVSVVDNTLWPARRRTGLAPPCG